MNERFSKALSVNIDEMQDGRVRNTHSREWVEPSTIASKCLMD